MLRPIQACENEMVGRDAQSKQPVETGPQGDPTPLHLSCLQFCNLSVNFMMTREAKSTTRKFYFFSPIRPYFRFANTFAPFPRASVRSSLIPTISLSGTTKDGTDLKSELSPQDASFLNGAFAETQTKAPPSSANSSAQSSSGGTTEFLLPGRTLGIFPVGFVITMIWTFFFVVVIGLGTFDRIRFREAYRRRLKRERTVGMRMI